MLKQLHYTELPGRVYQKIAPNVPPEDWSLLGVPGTDSYAFAVGNQCVKLYKNPHSSLDGLLQYQRMTNILASRVHNTHIARLGTLKPVQLVLRVLPIDHTGIVEDLPYSVSELCRDDHLSDTDKHSLDKHKARTAQLLFRAGSSFHVTTLLQRHWDDRFIWVVPPNIRYRAEKDKAIVTITDVKGQVFH